MRQDLKSEWALVIAHLQRLEATLEILVWGQTASLGLLIATTWGAPPMCQALCKAVHVHYFIKSITQSSCYFYLQSTDEKSEAQRGRVSPQSTEPVNGGAGMQAPFQEPQCSICNLRRGGWKRPASSVPGGPTALGTGKWPPRPLLGLSLSIPGKKVKYLRGAY